MNSVVVIESNTSGTGRIFLKRIIDYGYKPVFLTKSPQLYNFLKDFEYINIFEVDTENIKKILEICEFIQNNGDDICGVFSSSEYYIQITAEVADSLNLPGADSNAIKNCRNKYIQNQILSLAGLHIPKTYLIKDATEIEKNLIGLNFPMIAKPIEGSGSVGVKICKSMFELKKHCCELLSKKSNERGMSIDNKVLIEEYIEGEEFSAEVFNGKLIGITKKYLGELPFFVEIGHDYPAELKKDIKDRIESDICRAVEALGLRWGACHVEFRLKSQYVYFIEINPRLAGDLIPELVKYAQGIDLVDNQLRMALGLQSDLKRTRSKRAGIRFFEPEKSGEIKSFLVDSYKNESGIIEIKQYKKKGDYIKKTGDFRERAGHIIFDINKLEIDRLDQILTQSLFIS